MSILARYIIQKYNIPNKMQQSRALEGTVYEDLSSTSGTETVFDRHLAQENESKTIQKMK